MLPVQRGLAVVIYDPERALWRPGRRSFLFMFGAAIVAPSLPDVQIERPEWPFSISANGTILVPMPVRFNIPNYATGGWDGAAFDLDRSGWMDAKGKYLGSDRHLVASGTPQPSRRGGTAPTGQP